MRTPTREDLDKLLAVGGVIAILLQVAFITSSRIDVTIVLAAILVNQIGVWSLASRLFPDRRKYMLLRTEVRQFLGLVTELNELAVAGESEKIEATREAMLESVDRMIPVAAIPIGSTGASKTD